MERAEYMKIMYKYFPVDVRAAYNLDAIVTPGDWVYVKTVKGMHGLKQAAGITYDVLKTRLATHDYSPCPENINRWRHKTRLTKSSICVDNFGIKYVSKVDAKHLLNSLKCYYNTIID